MDSLTQKLEKLNITEHYSGEILSSESDFLEETKEKVEKDLDFSKCSFYFGKRIPTLSVELSISQLTKLLANYFCKKEVALWDWLVQQLHSW